MMRIQIGCALGIVAAFAVAGCSHQKVEAVSSEHADANRVQVHDVVHDVAATANTTRVFADKEREHFMRALSEEFAKVSKFIDGLEQRESELSGDAKVAWEKTLANLRKKRHEFQKVYVKTATAGDHDWQNMKADVETAWKNLEQAVKEAAGHFERHSPSTGA